MSGLFAEIEDSERRQEARRPAGSAGSRGGGGGGGLADEIAEMDSGRGPAPLSRTGTGPGAQRPPSGSGAAGGGGARAGGLQPIGGAIGGGTSFGPGGRAGTGSSGGGGLGLASEIEEYEEDGSGLGGGRAGSRQQSAGRAGQAHGLAAEMDEVEEERAGGGGLRPLTQTRGGFGGPGPGVGGAGSLGGGRGRAQEEDYSLGGQVGRQAGGPGRGGSGNDDYSLEGQVRQGTGQYGGQLGQYGGQQGQYGSQQGQYGGGPQGQYGGQQGQYGGGQQGQYGGQQGQYGGQQGQYGDQQGQYGGQQGQYGSQQGQYGGQQGQYGGQQGQYGGGQQGQYGGQQGQYGGGQQGQYGGTQQQQRFGLGAETQQLQQQQLGGTSSGGGFGPDGRAYVRAGPAGPGGAGGPGGAEFALHPDMAQRGPGGQGQQQQFGLGAEGVAGFQGQGQQQGEQHGFNRELGENVLPDTQQGAHYDQQHPYGQQQVAPYQQPLAPAFFSLEELESKVPPDQRHVRLEPYQANDIIEQMEAQPFDGAPRPMVIDLKDVQETFRLCISADRGAYINQLEMAAPGNRLPINAKPSLLQTKLKSGQNRLEDLVNPIVEPGAQSFVDLSFTPDGALLPESMRVWQFSMTPLRVEGVGPTGLKSARNPCLYVARMCLYDRARHRFVGNVLGVKPKSVINNDVEWIFDPEVSRVIVRCNCVQPDPRSGTRLINDEHLCLYIEFNTSYRLTVEDTRAMPPSEKKASRMVDEIASCWAMVNFRKCCTLGRDMNISVPLYYGSIADAQLLDALYKAERQKSRLASLFRPREKPVFTFRAGPLMAPGQPAPLLPYAYMPTTMLALEGMASLLAAYRVTLALQLGRQATPFGSLSDPVLSTFPAVLADHHLLVEVLLKWRDITEKMMWTVDAGCLSPQVLPPIASLVEAFRRCCMDVSPLVRCATLPPRHINNFVEYQGHRLKLVQQFCHIINPKTNTIMSARHPVEPLSHAGFEFLHKPFNTSELKVCLGNRLEKGASAKY